MAGQKLLGGGLQAPGSLQLARRSVGREYDERLCSEFASALGERVLVGGDADVNGGGVEKRMRKARELLDMHNWRFGVAQSDGCGEKCQESRNGESFWKGFWAEMAQRRTSRLVLKKFAFAFPWISNPLVGRALPRGRAKSFATCALDAVGAGVDSGGVVDSITSLERSQGFWGQRCDATYQVLVRSKTACTHPDSCTLQHTDASGANDAPRARGAASA